MKHIFRLTAMLTLVLLISVISCKKKKAEPTYDVSHLNEYFAGLRTTPQNITVQAGRDTVLSGASGTILHFYANSFKDASGNVITGGNISIQLIEMYKPGDMIANRTSTTADNKPLQSGGQIYIVATQNGNKVLANSYGIGFKQEASSGQRMELYYQSNPNQDSTVTWKMSDTTTRGRVSETTIKADPSTIFSKNAGVITPYSFPGFYHLFDSCTSFDWINCDHPAMERWGMSTHYTTAHVVVADKSFTKSNTQVFFVFPTINCTEDLKYYDISTNTI